MAFESISPNMNMPIPGVNLTSGPQWASDLNASLTIVDQHNHTPGNGVQITPSGLNINTDLEFLSNNALDLRSVRFDAQLTALSLPADLGCIYVAGVDLYYNDTNGNQIQITDNGGVAGTPGSIANLVSPASASYVAIDSTFVWQSDVDTPANMDFASAILRNLSANSFGLTLQPPAAMGSDYSLTLPQIPASQKIMTLDNSGVMAAPYVVDNVTIEINSNTIRVKDLGISTAKIADEAITVAKLAPHIIQDGTSTQTFTSNGTFNVPAGITYVFVSGNGGGGGGGSGASSNTTAGGGGGGEGAPWYESIRIAVTPLDALAVVVGAAGAAGAAPGLGDIPGNAGTAGASSTIANLILRGGRPGAGGLVAGAGGAGGSSTSGNPSFGAAGGNAGSVGGTVAGQAGAGTVFTGGGSGGASGNTSGAGGGGGSCTNTGGTGGNSGGPNGSAGTAGGGTNSGAGGGGGGGANGAGTGGAGGAGQAGKVIVRWIAI